MIVIFSSHNDQSTAEVTHWLTKFQAKFIVVNASKMIGLINIIPFTRKNAIKYLESVLSCRLDDIHCIWCRKWEIQSLTPTATEIEDNLALNLALANKVNRELLVLNDFLFSLLPSEKFVNSFFNKSYSKPNQLITAMECGLKTPDTYLTCNRESLQDIPNQVITKSIDEALSFNYNGENYSCFTAVVNPEEIRSSHFAPSLLQNKIDKSFEVRTFVLGEKTFSSAIFSQKNIRTAVDYRHYDRNHPNRKAIFKLPEKIENKLINLFKKLNLKTGSADFIVDTNKDFIFLEVNPFGQFGMVSKPHNYQLEKRIAQYLIHGNN